MFVAISADWCDMGGGGAVWWVVAWAFARVGLSAGRKPPRGDISLGVDSGFQLQRAKSPKLVVLPPSRQPGGSRAGMVARLSLIHSTPQAAFSGRGLGRGPLQRGLAQKYPSFFFFSMLPASSESIRRPCRSENVVSSISWMISGRVVALESTAPESG